MSSNSNESLPLNYGRQATARKRWIRKIAFVVIVLALIVLVPAGWRWGRPYVEQAKYLRIQQRCLDYSPPESQIVFSSIPGEARELLTRPGYKVSPRPGEMNTVESSNAAFMPQCYLDFVKQIGLEYSPSQVALAFFHERRSATGHPRLVEIHFSNNFRGDKYTVLDLYDLATWKPGSKTKEIDVASGGYWTCNDYECRIHAGQADPSDDSHFTIDVDRLDTQSGVWHYGYLDGRLKDDYEVTLEDHLDGRSK